MDIKIEAEQRLRQMREAGPNIVAEDQFSNHLLHSIKADPAFADLRVLDVTFMAGETVDLASINRFSALEELVMIGVSRSVGALKTGGLERLRRVEIYSWQDARSLSFLADPTAAIEELSIDRCPNLHSLDGIQNLEKLHTLSVLNCQQLADIRAIEGLGRIESLRLQFSPCLHDITPITRLPSLKTLILTNTGAFPPEDLDEVRRCLPECAVYTGGRTHSE